MLLKSIESIQTLNQLQFIQYFLHSIIVNYYFVSMLTNKKPIIFLINIYICFKNYLVINY